jgi:hypothetical protein
MRNRRSATVPENNFRHRFDLVNDDTVVSLLHVVAQHRYQRPGRDVARITARTVKRVLAVKAWLRFLFQPHVTRVRIRLVDVGSGEREPSAVALMEHDSTVGDQVPTAASSHTDHGLGQVNTRSEAAVSWRATRSSVRPCRKPISKTRSFGLRASTAIVASFAPASCPKATPIQTSSSWPRSRASTRSGSIRAARRLRRPDTAGGRG